MAGKKGRSGPPKGSMNAIKNGTKLEKRRLTLGELPQELISVRREARGYRREIENEVVATKGEISVTDAHHIDTASAGTITAGICRWLLRNRIGDMGTSDVLACSQQILKSKQIRDSAVKALGLDKKPGVYDVLFTVPPVATENGKPKPESGVKDEETVKGTTAHAAARD